jgi:hypothetical protein
MRKLYHTKDERCKRNTEEERELALFLVVKWSRLQTITVALSGDKSPASDGKLEMILHGQKRTRI